MNGRPVLHPRPARPRRILLTGAEAHHLTTVRRFGPGDRVTLFNGDGNEYPAEVVAAGKKSVTLNILSASPVDRELPFPLVVASALPKGDRADFLIEKLTELGVTRSCRSSRPRSVVRPEDSAVEKFSPGGDRGEQAVRAEPADGGRPAAAWPTFWRM